MANFWNDLTKWLEDASKVVGKEAGDLTLKGRLKLEVFELNRNLKENFADLGTQVFEEVFVKKNEKWQKDRKITNVIKKIKRVQTKLRRKEKEYKNIGKKPKRTKKK